MAGESLITRLLETPYVAPPSLWKLQIARFQSLILGALVVAFIVLSTVNIYRYDEIAIAVATYAAYEVSAKLLLKHFAPQSDDRELVRGMLGLALTMFGAAYFDHARGPIWLLVVLPLWRVLEFDVLPPFGFVFGSVLTLFGNIFDSVRASDNAKAMVSELGVRITCIAMVMAIIYGYVELSKRSDKSNQIRKNLIRSIGEQMFSNETLEGWCWATLERALTVTNAKYATFQINNRLTGQLDLVGAMMRDDREFSRINLRNHKSLRTFATLESAGITGRAAQEDTLQVVLSVVDNEDYKEFFPDTTSEIAAPVSDLITGTVGGVLNLEYVLQHTTSAAYMFRAQAQTIGDFSKIIEPAFGYILLSNLRSQLRTVTDLMPSANREDDVAFRAVDGLYRIFKCPVAIWLRRESMDMGKSTQSLELITSRNYPPKYLKGKTQLAIDSSKLGRQFIRLDAAKQFGGLSDELVDGWDNLVLNSRVPSSMILVPLIEIGIKVGVVQVLVNREVTILDHELEILTEFGHQVAFAIMMLRRYYTDRAEFLADEMIAASHDLASSLFTIDQLVNSVLAAMGPFYEDAKVIKLSKDLRSEIEFLREIKELVGVGSDDLPMGLYRIEDILGRAVETLVARGEINPNTVKIRKLQPDIETAYCCKVVAVSAIRNILKNAKDATSTTDEIDVSVSNDSSGIYINIDVRNYGSAIKTKHLESIFQPGFTTKSEGHGIGLSRYKLLLQRTLGELSLIYSGEAHGTSFRVALRKDPPKDV